MAKRTTETPVDLIVVGGGAGGIGASVAAARLGLKVALVEGSDRLGGNVTNSLVCTWEPGIGGTGIPFDLYRRLEAQPDAVGVFGHGALHCGVEKNPIVYVGESVPRPDATYAHTLRRHGYGAEHPAFQVSFDPDRYATKTEAWLSELGVEVLLSRKVVATNAEDGIVKSVRLDDGTVLSARFFVDSSATGRLAEASGCAMLYGRESRATFREPSASDEPDDRINGVTLLYRVTPIEDGDPVPEPARDLPASWLGDRFPGACVNSIPGGDLVINVLPTLEGKEFFSLGDRAYAVAKERSEVHWMHMRRHYPALRRFRLRSFATHLGVREGKRILAERMLTEHDLLAGWEGQEDPDLIALADHPMDRHGTKEALKGVNRPYGVPYRCLVPRGFRNLLVACRAAGFSSLAASSCRLTRTMMQLGQAAGTAAALATREKRLLPEVDPRLLRESLASQGVTLAWPMEDGIRERLGAARNWYSGHGSNPS